MQTTEGVAVLFRVELETGQKIFACVIGKMRIRIIKVVPGDM
jgi:translation initiation factor IF-1